MKKTWQEHITRTSDEMRNFNNDELTTKMFNSVLNYKELETRINEFNNNFRYTTFSKSLGFQLGRSMKKHCSPAERIYWETNVRFNGLLNDNVNDKTTLETISIMNDFINAESKKSMEQMLVNSDILTRDWNIRKNRPVYDYTVFGLNDPFENYNSILFDSTNSAFIKYYYHEYLSYFPVTLAEFEKTFFFFLTFLAAKLFPSYMEINYIYSFIKEINEIIRMRYIDINDRLIMSIINIINTDPELQTTCSNIYEEINDVTKSTISQAFGDWS